MSPVTLSIWLHNLILCDMWLPWSYISWHQSQANPEISPPLVLIFHKSFFKIPRYLPNLSSGANLSGGANLPVGANLPCGTNLPGGANCPSWLQETLPSYPAQNTSHTSTYTKGITVVKAFLDAIIKKKKKISLLCKAMTETTVHGLRAATWPLT